MKRSKGIGPNNLGASKSAVKNKNKGYGTVATKIGMGAEAITKHTKSQTDTFGPGGTDPNPKLYAGIVAEAQKKGKKEEGSMASQTRSEIRANKIALKAEKAVKDDKMNKNSRLVDKHNNLVDRKNLNKEKIAKG